MLLNLFQGIDPQSQGFKTHHGNSIVYLFIFFFFFYLFVPSAKALIENKKLSLTCEKIKGLHAQLVLDRQRKAVTFFRTIHKQINKASNIFRTTKSARVK